MRDKSPITVIPVVQIRPSMLLIYNRVEGFIRSSNHSNFTPLHDITEEKTYAGQLNQNSIKRLKRAITLLVAISRDKTATNFKQNKDFKFKLNFITLTLPGPQGNRSDKQIKKEVLDVWFKAAKRLFRLTNYVWRAERQKNKNIHFHIISDVYVPYDQLRDSWNQRLNRMQFIDEFEAKHGHRHPNSTDVHAIKSVKDLAKYMVKYMTKREQQGDVIEGKVWDCSSNLKTKKFVEFVIDSSTEQMIEDAINVHAAKFSIKEQCSFVYLDGKLFDKVVTGRYAAAYSEWIQNIRNKGQGEEPPP